MKYLLISFLLSFSLLGIDLSEVRTKYTEAQDSPQITQELYLSLSENPIHDEVLMAYKGAVLTLKAKHSKALKEKKAFFREGVELLDSAIDTNPENLEMRFIRLSVQENAPKIVRYNTNIQEDKLFIQQNYNQCKEQAVMDLIKNYIKTSTLFTPAEKQLF